MKFSEKFITLMDVTKTSNKDLAAYLHVDPSMISQIRTNRRKVPAKSGHFERMANYFANSIKTEYQMLAIADIIGIERSQMQSDVEFLETIILKWLMSEDDANNNQLLNSAAVSLNRSNNAEYDKMNVVYKDCTPQNKYELHKIFIDYLAAMDTPTTIYLESDEPMGWLAENEDLEKQLSKIMYDMKVEHQIIHILNPISKAETFMQELKLWMPIYLTGRSRMYTYPRFQDNFIKKTRYYIPNELLYRSESSDDRSYYALLSTNPAQMQIVGNQIKDFLKVCKPVTFLHSKERDIFNCFSYYARASADRIAVCSTLVPDSLPFSEVLDYMKGHPEYKSQYKLLQKLYEDYDYLPMNKAYEMCRVATAEEVKAGKVRMLIPGRKLKEGKLFYTPELYVIHLKHIVHLLKTNSNYHFYPYVPVKDNVIFLVYEGIGALITDPIQYDNLVEFRSNSIVEALNDYAYQILQTLPRKMRNRNKTIEILEKLIDEIEEK